MHDLLAAPKSSGCSRCNSCLQNAHSGFQFGGCRSQVMAVAMLMLCSLGQLSLARIEASSDSVMVEC